ncbi:MAG: M36 family metallopeptidase, partial [Sphingobacteriales bacterium]|nr:M36 family metallopeptidase [Sphingobacteriales bacterium]
PVEAPTFGSLATVNNPWLDAGNGNAAAVFGWQLYNGITSLNYTRGNNVFAYSDQANVNAPGYSDTSSTALPSLTFSKVPDFALQPAVTKNLRAATTNLFYVTNKVHDISYQYGFDEPSGNFQVSNNGKGGSGFDPVNAEAQDGGGVNNANMSTLPDGQSPRMQMYLWSSSNPFSTLTVNGPAGIAGDYVDIESNFSPNNLLLAPITAAVIYFNDDVSGTMHQACVSPANTLTGKIVFIDRGNCNFTDKVLAAQNAGALAVIIIDNVNESPFAMGGFNATVTIPAFMISKTDGALLTAQINNGETITLKPSPPKIDGCYDAGVIAHEYAHGISNRLTGGPANTSCLNNAEQAGEGWSDYMALMVTQNWATTTLADSLVKRTVGTYVLGEPATGAGLRSYPYCLNKAVNPLTYAYMNGGTGGEVHFIGEIWTAVLWDMTWKIIQQEGSIEPDIYNAASNGGNAIALNLVMMGMKLQLCSPGFLDARDAILKADSLLYNNRHKCAIWSAFARRGMGYSAKQGSSNSTSDQTVAFDVPTYATIEKTAIADSISVSDTIAYTIKVSCGCTVLTNLNIVDTLPAGSTYINSSAGSSAGNIVTIPVSFTQPSQTSSYIVNTKSTLLGCTITYSINDNRESNTIGGFSTVGGRTVNSAKSASGTSSWFATEPVTTTDITLMSSSILLSNSSLLSFNHYFNTENTYDGGVIEISVNGGGWQDLGSKIIKGSYTTAMDASTTLSGRQAFSGLSNGFQQTIVDLSSFTGQTVAIRFRFITDDGNSTIVEGWFVDDIKLVSGCLVKNTAGIYNSVPAKIAGSAAAIFIQPAKMYKFTGNGNWNIAGNWEDNRIPPIALPAGSQIIIDPVIGGECILTTAYTVSSGSILTVMDGKVFRITGDLIISSN